jgi:hypothetical protein
MHRINITRMHETSILNGQFHYVSDNLLEYLFFNVKIGFLRFLSYFTF